MISKGSGLVKTTSGIVSLRSPERLDVVNSTLSYEGRTADRSTDGTDQPKWQIIQVSKIGSETIRKLANDVEDFDQIWDNRNDGIIFPVPPFSNINSLQFDGVDEYVDFGDNFDFGPSTAFTWSFWMKPNNLAAQRVLISKTSNDSNVFGYVLYHNSSGKPFIQFRAPSQLRSYTFSGNFTAGAWQHVVLTYSGAQNINGARIYINGVVDAGVPASGTLTNAWDHTTPFLLARRSTSFHYSGNMNNLSVWDKALSAAEITELYNAGTPSDLSSHSATLNLLGWWLLNDPANFPSELDNKGAIDGTLTNMEVGDYVADVP